jgi:hypothetical protein
VRDLETSDVPARATAGSPTAPHSIPERSVATSGIPIDLAALCVNSNGTNESTFGGSPTATTNSVPSPASPSWNESWYLSYVLQTTNNERYRLYQPISRDSTRVPAAGIIASLSSDDTPRKATSAKISTPTTQNSLPPAPLLHDMLDEYFTTIHLFCPIVDKEELLDSAHANTAPETLLRCMMFAASYYCKMDVLRRLGYTNRIEAEDDLFSKAKTAFESGLESDRRTMLLCAYLLHYWQGSPNKTRDAWWWLAGAIRSAQLMDLHRRVQSGSMDEAVVRSRRRIWWLLYVGRLQPWAELSMVG